MFALHRELLGTRELQLEVPVGATVGEATAVLLEQFPALRGLGESLVVAVNAEYAKPQLPLKEGDEMALIPPVSGGDSRFCITYEPLNPRAVEREVQRHCHGAVVTFLGVVRDHSEGKPVLHLEYEAFPEMAEAKLRQIGLEVKEHWGEVELAVHHRLGHLDIGEISLVIAAASPHREEAFAACRYALERIKEMVPIWKKELFAQGARWVGKETS